MMLTTADVYAKDYAQFKRKGFGSHAFLIGRLLRPARWRHRQAGDQTASRLAGKKVLFAPYTPSPLLAVEMDSRPLA